MDFDFLWKMILTCCFMGVTICLCVKWIVEVYLDYVQVMMGIKVVTLAQMKEQQAQQDRQEFDDDPFAR
jgi:hypothetical protein